MVGHIVPSQKRKKRNGKTGRIYLGQYLLWCRREWGGVWGVIGFSSWSGLSPEGQLPVAQSLWSRRGRGDSWVSSAHEPETKTSWQTEHSEMLVKQARQVQLVPSLFLLCLAACECLTAWPVFSFSNTTHYSVNVSWSFQCFSFLIS